MPSDDRTAVAVKALAGPRDAYLSALTTTTDAVRAWLDGIGAAPEDRSERLAAEFGMIGRQYLDTARLAALMAETPRLAESVEAAARRALTTLEELMAGGPGRFCLSASPGTSVAEAIGAAYAEAGRGFGAARVVELARSGRYHARDHYHYLTALPFADWTAAERRLAPPLVVEVNGGDLQAGGLAEFLDGGVKIVLIVRPPAPPAPLVRLVTPGMFLAQSPDDRHLAALAAWPGAGLVAIMPPGAAVFLHNPAGGDLGTRLLVSEFPDAAPRRRIGRLSVAQQEAELEQLHALADAGHAAPVPALAGSGEGDQAGRLAAWLLQQVDLSGV